MLHHQNTIIMKKLFFLSALLLMSVVTFAQQALWGGAPVVSPEIHDDNTVTFRLKAPKAIKVQVTGDFLPAIPIETPRGIWEGPGIADLKEGKDGVWEYTTPEPLAPELYMYSFIVDGLKIMDPSNVYMIRDVATVTNVFIIGGGRAEDRRMTIYTPAGYEKSGKRYPVFYLLHGGGGDEEAWINLGRTSQILDNLIAQGKAEPMIVVMTNGNPWQQAAAGESPLGFVSPSLRSPEAAKAPEGAFEMSFPEVVKFIEKNFRVKKGKKYRAIAGLSMGCGHAANISRYYPDMFDYVGLFSGSASARPNSTCPVFTDFEEKLKIQLQDNKPALYYIACGKIDFVQEGLKKYLKLLDEKGYKYEYFENEGGHIWRNWRIYLTEFAPKIFK